MKLDEVLKQAAKSLKSKGNPTPRLDAEVILAHLLKVERIYFILNRDKEIDNSILEDYRILIKRRSNGEPAAYIVGQQEFMGLNFKVNHHVLIPRPDTEILVEYVIEFAKEKGKTLEILDIGTGSGAIGLSLAYYLPHCNITLADISSEALNIATENARKLHLSNVHFALSDCFENIDGKYDIIVSNPPYIPAKEIEELQIEVSRYEPRGALDGGLDGLDFYRRITSASVNFIKKGGLLAFEIGYDQADDVIDLLGEFGYENIEKRKDYGSNDRAAAGIYQY